MPRFYFHLMSKESRIPDDRGKNFETLNDAHEHGRKLIDKILLHVGYDDANEWKVIVSSDEDATSKDGRCRLAGVLTGRRAPSQRNKPNAK